MSGEEKPIVNYQKSDEVKVRIRGILEAVQSRREPPRIVGQTERLIGQQVLELASAIPEPEALAYENGSESSDI